MGTRNWLLRIMGFQLDFYKRASNCEDHQEYRQFMRITPIQFECLLRKVSSIIQRADTCHTTCHKFTINLELI